MTLDRRYLKEGEGHEEPVVDVEAVAFVLERLFWPLAESGSLEQVGSRLLEFALDQTQRERGLLGVFDPNGRLSVLASCNRREVGKDLLVPEAVISEARTASKPFLHSTRHGSTLEERLVVPLGPEPRRLLVLEARLPDGPSNRACLRLGKALGEIIRCRLAETQAREQLREEIERLRFHQNPAHATILASTRLHPLRRTLKEAGGHDLPVLFVGEEGTEGEDLARYLHTQSSRILGPFVSFLAASPPAHRVEEELFGSGKLRVGDRQAQGALLRAQGGTLYIENPDALPPHVQARLLQVLENARPDVRDEATGLDVRILASVTEHPKIGASGDLLVEGLAKALAGIQIWIPPLRGHVEDIASLVDLILLEMGPGPEGKPHILTKGAKRKLLDYHWPGNLRQLRTVLEAAVACSGPQPIAARHLPADVREATDYDRSDLVSLEEVEEQHIRRVLEALGGNRAKTAKVLGIATSTLYEKMKRYNLRG